MKYKHIVFDCFGTLVDDEEIAGKSKMLREKLTEVENLVYVAHWRNWHRNSYGLDKFMNDITKTYVYQQSPFNPETPHGAWDFHETLIPHSPVKPIRIWMEVGDKDNYNARDAWHDWVLANENMAKVLAAKGYHYQFIFAMNTGHTEAPTKRQTLPQALQYIWQGFTPPKN